MNDIKQCNNGHSYSQNLEKCPICSDERAKEVNSENIESNNRLEQSSLQLQQNINGKIKLISYKIINWFKINAIKISFFFLIFNFLLFVSAVFLRVLFFCISKEYSRLHLKKASILF